MQVYAIKLEPYMKLLLIFAGHNFNFFSKCISWYNLLIVQFSDKNRKEIREEITGPNIFAQKLTAGKFPFK